MFSTRDEGVAHERWLATTSSVCEKLRTPQQTEYTVWDNVMSSLISYVLNF